MVASISISLSSSRVNYWVDPMRLLRRIAGLLGLAREEDDARRGKEGSGGGGGGGGDGGGGEERTRTSGAAGCSAAAAARGGFGVQVPVAVEKPALSPVLVPCEPGEGGVQVLDSPHFPLFLLLDCLLERIELWLRDALGLIWSSNTD